MIGAMPLTAFIIYTFLFCFCIFVFVENKPGEISELWETEEEKTLSIGQLKYRYLQFAKQKFQGKVFFNKNTEKPIKVSKDGIMEWWRKSRRREHTISVQLLDYFLKNGNFIGENSDYLGRKKIQSASQFETACKVNGKYYKVIITTRRAIFDIDKFRYYALKDIETK
jgi:hypothetical protein